MREVASSILATASTSGFARAAKRYPTISNIKFFQKFIIIFATQGPPLVSKHRWCMGKMFTHMVFSYFDWILLVSSLHHRVRYHRVAIADFRRTSHHDGKIIPGWWGWELHAHPPFGLLSSRTKLQCMLLLRGQIHCLYFISTLYALWGLHHK